MSEGLCEEAAHRVWITSLRGFRHWCPAASVGTATTAAMLTSNGKKAFPSLYASPWIFGFSSLILHLRGELESQLRYTTFFSTESKTTSHITAIAQSRSCLGTGGNVQRTTVPTQINSDHFGKNHFTVNLPFSLCKKEQKHIHWPQSHFSSFVIFCSSASSISEHQT